MQLAQVGMAAAGGSGGGGGGDSAPELAELRVKLLQAQRENQRLQTQLATQNRKVDSLEKALEGTTQGGQTPLHYLGGVGEPPTLGTGLGRPPSARAKTTQHVAVESQETLRARVATVRTPSLTKPLP